jgi:thioredoxin 1
MHGLINRRFEPAHFFRAARLACLLALAGAPSFALAAGDVASRVRDALASRQPVLLEFGATTCNQCRRMNVVLQGVSQRYKGRAHVVQINVGEEKALTRQYRIMVIPTLVYFDTRGREAGRQYGYQDEVKVARRLHELGAR